MQVSAKKLEYAHEEKMAEIDIQMQQAELESVERQSSIEWTGKTNVAEAKALAASYGADKASYTQADTWLGRWLFPIVDFLRGITRPA